MGQYWVIANIDKREYVNPCKLGAGAKLWEVLANNGGAALVVLCAAERDARGGGDLDKEKDKSEIIGRWAGDRVALVGDYAERSDLPEEWQAETIYKRCLDGDFKDITPQVLRVLKREIDWDLDRLKKNGE